LQRLDDELEVVLAGSEIIVPTNAWWLCSHRESEPPAKRLS